MKQYVRGIVNPHDLSDPEDDDHHHMQKVKKAGVDKINQYHGNLPDHEQNVEDDKQAN